MLLLLLALAPAAPAAAPALVGAALAPARALEQHAPKNDGWVTDLAGMLTPAEERELEALMESYQQGSGHDVALLTVPDLGGGSIEELGLAVGREWKLGREGVNDGAVLIVAKAERKTRIEVGRGLEGTLTDSISGRILRDVIAPEFRAGRFASGLRAGIEAIHAAAGGDYAKLPPERRHRDGKTGPGDVLGALFGFGFLLLMLVLAGASARRAGRGRRGRGSWVEPMLWGALLGSSLRGGGRHRGGGFGGFGGFGGGGGGGFGGFGGGGGFSGGGASGGW